MKKNITVLVIFTAVLSIVAASMGIFTQYGDGSFFYESIRGETIQIYGKGLYRHMSADVAIQGIAQDVVTLFIAVPLLILALIGYLRGSQRSKLLLTGISGYFFVTYLFYMAMGMYNYLFLVYISLLGLSFWSLLLLLTSFDPEALRASFSASAPVKFTGGFLVFNAISIALLWLSVIVPPLLTGSVFPEGLDHYTTMIVQGFDLGLMLPLAIVSGLLLWRKTSLGYLAGTVYIVFLSLLMSALTAKLIGMALHDVNVVPAIFIIPLFNLVSIICAVMMIRSLGNKPK